MEPISRTAGDHILSNSFYKSLYENHPDLIFLMDLNGNIIEVNQKFTKTLGYLAEDFKVPFQNLIRKDQVSLTMQYFEKASQGEVQYVNVSYFHKGGYLIDLNVTFVPVIINSDVNGICGVARDTTEKIQLEQRYKSLFSNLNDVAFVADSNGIILDVNEAALNITGFSRDDLINKPFIPFVNPESAMDAEDNFKRVLQGKSESIELSVRHKNGHCIDVEINTAPIIINDRIAGVIGIFKDITEHKKARWQLQESEQKYKSLFEQNPDAVSYFDLDGSFITCNSSLHRILGYSLEELVNNPFDHLVDQTDLTRTKHHFEQTIKGEAQSYEIVCRHKDGYPVYMHVTNIPVVVDCQIIGVYGIAKDITDKKQAYMSLYEAESKYRSLVENSFVGVYIIQDNLIIYANPRLHEILGSSKLTGTNVWDIIDSDDLKKVRYKVGKITNDQDSFKEQFRVKKQDGTIIDVEVYSTRLFYQGKPAVIGTILDITDRKRSEELHTYLAYHDPLTNLPNRRFFEDKLEHLLMKSQQCNEKFAVMYLDMDRFKYINDTLGHSTGDRLLQQISVRLQQCLPENAEVARMGGDEFTILLPNLQSVDCAVHVAQDISKKLRTAFLLDEYELFITTSIGISIFPTDGEDRETLMKNADSALYLAKDQGKNNYQIFTSSMNVQSYKIFSLEKELRKAINNNEFELYYQPKVNSITGEIAGAEALLRWNHPDWGVVLPHEFIALAEETGLIKPIEICVKRMVCKQIKEWQDAGLPLIPISINISALRFLQNDLVKNIQSILKEINLDPCWLELEILESSLLENSDVVSTTLAELRELGIKISLDDFGTGYSSLSYLKQYKNKIDFLKIDKSFIRDLRSDSEDLTIIQAIIQLAHALNIKVVAEGVETEEQLSLLRKQKCDLIQGYLYSRPVTTDDFVKLLQKGTLTINREIHNQSNLLLEEHRQYFRINLPFPLSAFITITKIKGRDITLGKTEVFIKDIGLGGVRFLCNIKLAVHHEIILQLETEILEKTVQLHGVVVWLQEIDTGIYQYGLEFYIDENLRSSLAQLLNKLAVHLRKSSLVPNCSFVTVDPITFLKSINNDNIH